MGASIPQGSKDSSSAGGNVCTEREPTMKKQVNFSLGK